MKSVNLPWIFYYPFFTHKKNNKMSSLFYRHCMKNELKKQIKYTHITHIRPVLKLRHRISHLSMVQLEFLWTSAISDNNLTLIYRISSQKIVWRCKTWNWNDWKVEEKMQLFKISCNILFGEIFLFVCVPVKGAKLRHEKQHKLW